MILLLISWSLLPRSIPPSQAYDLRFEATIEAFGAAYLVNRRATEKQYGEIRFRPTMHYAPLDDLLLHVEVDFRADTEGFARGAMDSVVERTGRRWMADVREAYIEYSHDWFRMRLGKQIFDWSVTDTVSPADNINPRDWTDILEMERVSIPSAYLHVGYNTYAELVVTPWFTPSKLPVIGSRWERELPPGLVNAEQEVPGRDHGQLSVRAGTSWEGFDLGAVYYRGYSMSPSFKLHPVSFVLAELVPVYRFEEVYSLSCTRAVREFTVRGEVGAFRQREEDDFIQYVVGIDREWSGLLKPVDSLYVLLQYANEVVTRQDRPLPFSTIDFRRVLDNAIMAKVTYDFDSEKRWTVKFEAAINLEDGGSFFEPALVWRKHHVEWELGIDILSGGEGSFFGGYGENDRVYTKITCKF